MKPARPNPLTAEQSGMVIRNRTAGLWKSVFFFATLIAIIALATLILNTCNQAFGMVVTVSRTDPATLSEKPLDQLNSTELMDILRKHITTTRSKTLEAQQPLETRTQQELLYLVQERIVQPKIEASWTLFDSIFHRAEIEKIAAEEYPSGVLSFRAWLNPDFILNSMASQAEDSGVRPALLGSLYMIAITILFAFPIGVGAAIYLEEYADKKRWYNRVIQTNIDNLAGVPSIVYGILGLAIFVRLLSPLTSGELFGVDGGNGRTILSAGLTMGLLILPILIINAQEAIRSVPSSLRQASYGLGATKWQTIWNHILPYALPGILTGTILAISRAIGETAPLIVVGASTFISSDPNSPFSKFTALPIQIYDWTSRPQDVFRNSAAAAILVLLITLLSINAIAIFMRNRFSKRI